MRVLRYSAAILALLACPSLAYADPPVDPMEGVVPDPVPAPAPAPAKPPAPTLTPAAPAPAPAPAPAAPAPPPPPPPTSTQERETLTAFGVGPTWFLMAPTGAGPRWSSPGVVLHVAADVPLDDHFGLGVRFAWGLTEFRRFEDFARAGYKIGDWTTTAYKNVWNWAAEKDDAQGLKTVGAFFAFAVLWMPYIVAGLAYAFAPLATTTYLEADVTLDYDFGTDAHASGPYLKGGLGLVGFLHPHYDTLLGGVGPTAGVGIRAGKFDVSLNGTWLPPVLHGDTRAEHSNVFITSLQLGVF